VAVEYCNITTDLLDVYIDLNNFRRFRTLKGADFVLSSGSVYKLQRCGFMELVYEDGDQMTASDPATTTPAAGEFSYDAATDVLYIRMTDSAAPSTHVVESGYDWGAFLTRMRNRAQEEFENLLSPLFVIPFQKIHEPFSSYNSRSYDEHIVQAIGRW